MARRMKTVKCPSEELSLTNCAIVSDRDFDINKIKHLEVITGSTHRYIFTIKPSPSISPGSIGFSAPQRKWAVLSLGQEVDVRPHEFNPSKDYLSNITLEMDFLNKKNITTEPYDTEKMAAEFSMQFPNQAFTVGQELVFSFTDKKMLLCKIKELEAIDIQSGETKKVNTGKSMPNTTMCFEKSDNSSLNLVGKFKGKQVYQSMFQSNWNFKEMGVGGMDDQMSIIFRRAFISRVLPAEIFDQMGSRHCRGILMFGPPGTGKTLIARQIGKMLNAREPKIINGPEILDKYVGESEANIRKLFAEAEEEQKRVGPNSALHIIIFDEIDAICKSRGSVAGSAAVHETVVNQLLSKMDGVNQLNNVLIIGMTNRKDMIDEALLRPGRLEVQLEIGLPDEAGRRDILKIHTTKLRQNNRLGSDVSLEELAASTKNFTGAELEGLVYAAISNATERVVKVDSVVEVDHEAAKSLQVSMTDFRNALINDVKAAFGTSDENLMRLIDRGIINWGEPVQRVLQEGDDIINQLKLGEQTGLLAVMFEGPAGCGKTALAAHIAMNSGFPFLKIASLSNMIGYHEHAKVQAINKMFNDSYKSPLNCIILDDLEGFIEYAPIGPRYSNVVYQALKVFLRTLPPNGKRLLIMATSGCREALEELGLLRFFDKVIHVSNLTRPQDLITCLEELSLFSSRDLEVMAKMIHNKKLSISIKRLLNLVDKVKLAGEEYRLSKFISILEEDGYLEM